MTYGAAVLENICIPTVCANVINSFEIIRTVYLIGIPVMYVQEQLNLLVTIIVLANKIPCRKADALNVNELVFFHMVLMGLLVDFNFDYKYQLTLKDMSRMLFSQIRPMNRAHARLPSSPYLLLNNDTCSNSSSFSKEVADLHSQ